MIYYVPILIVEHLKLDFDIAIITYIIQLVMYILSTKKFKYYLFTFHKNIHYLDTYYILNKIFSIINIIICILLLYYILCITNYLL